MFLQLTKFEQQLQQEHDLESVHLHPHPQRAAGAQRLFAGGCGAGSGIDCERKQSCQRTGARGQDAAGVVAGIGVLILILSGVGVWAGVMIAQRKKLGVHVAWGLIGAGIALSILASVLGETSIDWGGIGCNGICALFVGLPLMISSASQHME